MNEKNELFEPGEMRLEIGSQSQAMVLEIKELKRQMREIKWRARKVIESLNWESVPDIYHNELWELEQMTREEVESEVIIL